MCGHKKMGVGYTCVDTGKQRGELYMYGHRKIEGAVPSGKTKLRIQILERGEILHYINLIHARKKNELESMPQIHNLKLISDAL